MLLGIGFFSIESIPEIRIGITILGAIGLFGFAYAASITNLDLIKSRIQGKENVGALVGKANGSVLNNNHVQSRYIVSYTDNSGGLVGITDSTIVSYSSAQTDTMAG